MKYKTKSIIIGRMKRKNSEEAYPIFIHFFKINDPHKTGVVPEKMVEFEHVHKVLFKGLDVVYLIEGNDIVVNDLEYVEVEEKGPHLTISGKQK